MLVSPARLTLLRNRSLSSLRLYTPATSRGVDRPVRPYDVEGCSAPAPSDGEQAGFCHTGVLLLLDVRALFTTS